MNSLSNHPCSISTNSQVNSTTIATAGGGFGEESTEDATVCYNIANNCETFLSSISPEDDSYILSILAMSHPLGNEMKSRMHSLFDSRVLTKSMMRITNDIYIGEVKRRIEWLNLKSIKFKNWRNPKCKEWLEATPLTASELTVANSKLDSYFKEKEDKSKEMQEQAETNEILNKVNRKRFRLLHAVFHDRFRASLLNLYISKERRAFDAQNTTAAPPSFFVEVCALYNDESWTPHTFQFPDYDARFRNPISLPLEKDDGENNDVKVPEHVKRDFNDIRSKFKIMHADWK